MTCSLSSSVTPATRCVISNDAWPPRGSTPRSSPAARTGRPPRRRSCAFQQQRGLPASTASATRPTWTALVEAGYGPATGCSTCRARCCGATTWPSSSARSARSASTPAGSTASSGPQTERALRDFQRNAGLDHRRHRAAATCSPASSTLGRPPGRSTNVAGVRERETLRVAAAGARRAAASSSARPAASTSLAARPRPPPAGRRAPWSPCSHHPHPSVQAVEANDFGADLYLGLAAHRWAVPRPPTTARPASSRPADGSWPPCMVDELLDHARAADRRRRSAAGSRSCARPGCRRWCASSVRRRRSSSRRPSWPPALHRALEAWATTPIEV